MVDTASPSATVDKIAEAKQKRKPKPKPPADKARQPLFFELSRLMVVAIMASSSQLVYRAQTKPNGPWEANWTPIDTTQTYGVMASGTTGDGRVAVVAQPSNPTALFYIDEKANSAVQAWNAPVNLGKPAGINAFANLAMALDADARLEVFGTDTNGGIWWKYQNPDRIVQKTITVTPPGTTTPITVTVDETAPPLTPWSDWMQLPGELVQLSALRNADGRIILFGLSSAIQPLSERAEGGTSAAAIGLVRLGADGRQPHRPVSDHGAGAGFHRRRELFWHQQRRLRLACAPIAALHVHLDRLDNCRIIWGGVQALAAGTDGDDNLVLVATDNSKLHNINSQLDVQMQRWIGWNPFLMSDYPTQIALDYNSNGRLTLFSHWLLPPGQFGGLWCVAQMAYNSTEWEMAWTQLAPGDIRQLRALPGHPRLGCGSGGCVTPICRFSNNSTPPPGRRNWRPSHGMRLPSRHSWPSNSARSMRTTSSIIRAPTGS